ncbi:hypothetical protein R77555_04348 [Ralstonia mannitolilytica]|nr:hypothetical protein R77555_04348 [Ralstonia mannitolilytica]
MLLIQTIVRIHQIHLHSDTYRFPYLQANGKVYIEEPVCIPNLMAASPGLGSAWR